MRGVEFDRQVAVNRLSALCEISHAKIKYFFENLHPQASVKQCIHGL